MVVEAVDAGAEPTEDDIEEDTDVDAFMRTFSLGESGRSAVSGGRAKARGLTAVDAPPWLHQG